MTTSGTKLSELDLSASSLQLADLIPAIRETEVTGVYDNILVSGTQIRNMISENPPPGMMHLIASAVVSNSPYITFSNLENYKHVEFDLINIVPQIDNTTLIAYVSVDNGSSYLAGTNYLFSLYNTTASTGSLTGSTGYSACYLSPGLGNSTGEFYTGTLKLVGHDTTGVYKGVTAAGNMYDKDGVQRLANFNGVIKTTSIITDLVVLMSSGNINGQIKFRGMV